MLSPNPRLCAADPVTTIPARPHPNARAGSPMYRRAVVAAVLAAGGSPTAAYAQTVRHVPAEYSTIQAAVNACQNGDTVLVANGTYTGADLMGKAITVRSENGPS